MALTKRDIALLDAAASGASGEELGAILNLPPAACILRVQELLRDKDVWSEIERRQLLLHDMYNLKARMQRQIEETGMDAKDVGNYLKTLVMIAQMLEKASQISASQLERITAVQANVLMQMVLASFGRAKQVLAEQFPNADMLAIEAAFNDGLVEASTNVQSVV